MINTITINPFLVFFPCNSLFRPFSLFSEDSVPMSLQKFPGIRLPNKLYLQGTSWDLRRVLVSVKSFVEYLE